MRRKFIFGVLMALGILAAGAIGAITVNTFNIVDYIGVATAPSNPTTNKGRLYFSTADSKLHCLTSSGGDCSFSGGGGSPITGSGTTGFIPAFTSSSAIGNSHCDDGITTASTVTCSQSVSVGNNLTVSGNVITGEVLANASVGGNLALTCSPAPCTVQYGTNAANITNAFTGSVASFTTSTGVTVGSPTGGAEGAGTLNATGLFVNGVAVGTGNGTVTSVSFTGGLVSVANPTTTPAFTVTGTSGGIPYFSSASTWATSAAGTINTLMKWGGAGNPPIASTVTDAGSGVTIGSPTGGAEGAGTLNVAGGVFSNGSAVPIGCQAGCSYSVAQSDFPIPFGSVTSLMTANNTPQFIKFNNTTTKKLGNATVKTGTASAGGHFSIGVYSQSGTTLTLIWTTGSQSTTTGNSLIAVTPAAVQLQAGTNYYLAWCADNTTATVAGATNSGAAGAFGAAGAANSFGVNATDVCAAGVLPASATSTNIANNASATLAGIYATN